MEPEHKRGFSLNQETGNQNGEPLESPKISSKPVGRPSSIPSTTNFSKKKNNLNSDFGMRNSEFIKKLKRTFSFLNPNSAIPACRPRSRPRAGQAGAIRIPHFSMGQQKLLFVLALLILALLYLKFYFHRSPPSEETYREVVVEILGEVQKPGIYIFKAPPM